MIFFQIETYSFFAKYSSTPFFGCLFFGSNNSYFLWVLFSFTFFLQEKVLVVDSYHMRCS